VNSYLAAHRRRLLLDAPVFEYYPANGDVLVPRYPAAAPVTGTFTRANATATRVDSTGLIQSTIANQPRIDYDPISGQCLGLLMEEAKANLCFQSENFGTTWGRTNINAFGSGSTLNATTSPDGGATADYIQESSASGEHRMRQTIGSITAGSIVSMSVFAKAGERSWFEIRLLDSAATTDGGYAFFNLSTGAVGTTGGLGNYSGLNATIKEYKNGWYRCNLTVKPNGTMTSAIVDLFIASADNSSNYAGDNASGIYLWGAQLEMTAFPTSYIPTTTAAVTRAAETMAFSGTNFSNWFNASYGTFLIEGVGPPVTGTSDSASLARTFLFVSDGTASNYIQYARFAASTSFGGVIATGGVGQGSPATTGFLASERFGSALVYKANDLISARNGTLSSADTSASIPTVDRMHVGTNHASNHVFCGHIMRIRYYNTRIPNDQLQEMSLAW